MRKALLSALLACLVLVSPAGAAPLPNDHEVAIDGGIASLHGALLRPKGWSGGPGVLMIPGSGAVDRDASSPAQGFYGNDLRLLAEGLEAAGVLSLRIDKRCIADSAPACPGEDKLRLQTYVDDAVAWARFLKAQPGVTCVALLGHSEGALIVALAAARVATCGVISISGMGRRFDQVLEAQIKASGAAPAILTRVADIDQTLRAGRLAPDVPPILMNLYRPSVQPFLISEFAADPLAAIAAVKAPVLIVQGTTDLQVSVADAQALAAAHPDAELVLVEGANHVLKSAPPDRRANFAAYADPDLPLAPGVLDPIIDFVKAAHPPTHPPSRHDAHHRRTARRASRRLKGLRLTGLARRARPAYSPPLTSPDPR
jgi:pimeloyl-ACP methyl ester carboxylesterase